MSPALPRPASLRVALAADGPAARDMLEGRQAMEEDRAIRALAAAGLLVPSTAGPVDELRVELLLAAAHSGHVGSLLAALETEKARLVIPTPGGDPRPRIRLVRQLRLAGLLEASPHRPSAALARFLDAELGGLLQEPERAQGLGALADALLGELALPPGHPARDLLEAILEAEAMLLGEAAAPLDPAVVERAIARARGRLPRLQPEPGEAGD